MKTLIYGRHPVIEAIKSGNPLDKVLLQQDIRGEMEKEIRHEFLYGAFSDLEGGFGGMDGYRKFCEMRRKIRADRIRMKQEQENLEAEFWHKVQVWGGGSVVVVLGLFIMYIAIDFIFKASK